jgi:hypothetical protein
VTGVITDHVGVEGVVTWQWKGWSHGSGSCVGGVIAVQLAAMLISSARRIFKWPFFLLAASSIRRLVGP